MKAHEFQFSFFTGGIGQKDATPVKNFTLKELIEYYKSEGNKQASSAIDSFFTERAATTNLRDKEDISDLITTAKNSLPYFMAGGTFAVKNKAGLLSFNSNLICIDIDKLSGTNEAVDIRQHLSKQQGCLLATLSPKRKGVKALFYISEETTAEALKSTLVDNINVIAEALQISAELIDTAQFSPYQACFIAYDPNAYFNAEAEPLKLKFKKIAKPPEAPKPAVEIKSSSKKIAEAMILEDTQILINEYKAAKEGGRHEKIIKVQRIAGLCKQYKVEEEFTNEIREALRAAVVGMYKNEQDGNCLSSFLAAWNEAPDTTKSKAIDAALIEAKPKGSKSELVYIPTLLNKPPFKEPLISINEASILTAGNISCIIAQAGYGKSSMCEAILSKVINPECDGLGFNVSGKITQAVYIDCERTRQDTHASFERALRRAKLIDSDKIILANIRLANLQERKQIIIDLVEEFKPELLIIDGAGDLAEDTNSNIESNAIKFWLRTLAEKNNLSILTTLHPNPNTEKARGHLGSELQRECEAVVIIKKEGNLHKITTEFSLGKNRNAGNSTAHFAWNEELSMFTSNEPVSKRNKLEDLSPEEIGVLVGVAFKDPKKYNAALEAIRNYAKQEHPDQNRGETAIKNFIAYLRDKYIEQDFNTKLYSILRNNKLF